MSPEVFNPYSEQTATVVGGRGELGRKITTGFEGLGFQSVQICEQGDPFPDFAKRSKVIFFAVNNTEIEAMLQASRDSLKPDHSILDGASVKGTLIPLYRKLDNLGISIASTHLGAVPAQPWRGIKVWICEVGPNSERAKKLAFDLFLSTNSSIQPINIEDHKKVEIAQGITMITAYITALALQDNNFSLSSFNDFSTLNAELLALLMGRTLGQGTKVPSEILSNQQMGPNFVAALEKGLSQLKQVLESGDRDKLQKFMQGIINFHNPDGTVNTLFKKAGIVGARNANLRMHKLSFRITDDKSGALRRILEPFYTEDANLTAIDSMPGTISDEERERGVNPDSIVVFDIGIDPKTINPEKEARINKALTELGCRVIEQDH